MSYTFKNFADIQDYSELMKEFQSVHKFKDSVTQQVEEARRQLDNKRRYLDCLSNYKGLYLDMIKKLLDSKSEADVVKIRQTYTMKLVTALTDLEKAQSVAEGTAQTEQASRDSIKQKASAISSIMDAIQDAKKKVMNQEPKEPSVQLPDPEVLPAT
jgi:alpha-galactosidase/6-phospho-beta-glucosidase family protein